MRTLLGVAGFSLYPHRAEKAGEFCEVSFKRALDLPGGSDSKAFAYNVRDPGSILGLGRSPGEGNGNPPVLLPGKSHGRRSLVGYSLWGRKESDTTERLHFHFQSHS